MAIEFTDKGGSRAALVRRRERALGPAREPLGFAEFDSALDAARRGAEWAWSEVYRLTAPALLGYLRAQGAPEAEDLTAEVFLQVVKSLHQFGGDEAAFRSWIFVIAHRKLIDDRRYRARRPAAPAQAAEIESRGLLGDTEEEALNRLSEAEICATFDRLTEDQRDLLLLRILGGLTIPEAAEVLGKRAGSAASMQRRALRRLSRLEALAP